MQTINIDLSMRSVIPVLHAKQGDVGRKFKAVLTDGGTIYPVPGGAAVSVWYSGASGEGNYTDIGAQSAISVSGNEITVELITQMLTNPGAGTVCLVINTADGDELGTWNIPYCTEPRPGMNSAEAQAYFTAFSNAVQNLPYPDASLSIPGKAADAAATGAALAGKAPAGYGLGGAVATVAHPDEAVETGFYAVNNDAVMPAGHWWVGHVTKYVDGYAVQHFTRLVTGEKIQRYMDYGEWQPWEWENPHLYDGTEYRTTERHNGKAVYTKGIDAGTLPANNYKDIWFSSEATEIVDLRVVAHSGSWTNLLPLFGDNGIRTVYAARFNHNIRIYSMNTDSSGSTGTIYVKYTKG